MLRKIKLVPLAAESFGVRSMCTFIETPTLRVLLDAGVSLAPNRFRLPPHPNEFEAIKKARRRIAEFADKADVVTVSHYHHDHLTPSFEDWLCNWTHNETARQIYESKMVYAKNYRVNINTSQRMRGRIFEKAVGEHAKKLTFSDGRSFKFGETKLQFSHPVYHGSRNTPLGWLLMATITCDGEKALFASDVQGPMDNTVSQHILAEKPQLLVISGPPTYLTGLYVNNQQIQQSLKNLETLVKTVPTVIVEHHLLRDLEWRRIAQQIFKSARKAGHRIFTAAEYSGKENLLLEAKRKQLYKDDPPDSGFTKWSKLSEHKKRTIKPPI